MTDARDLATDELLVRIEDGVAVLTLHRPERRNALSHTLLGALARALEAVEVDEAVRCVVLTGAGGAFCAGGDVQAMAAGEHAAATTFDGMVHQQRLNQRATAGRLHRMPKPTIAMLDGAAAGAGLSLALACDLRFGSPKAFFTTAFAKVGLGGDYGGTWFLTHLVGPAKARELYLLSDRVAADEALALGLLTAVHDREDLEEQTLAVARRLATGPAVVFRYMKENLNRALTGELEECMDLEATHHLRTGLTEDHAEAARAFVEKRDPVFNGR